jgi:hypothetical protein
METVQELRELSGKKIILFHFFSLFHILHTFFILTYLTFTEFSGEAGRHKESTWEKCYHYRFRTSG